MIFHTVTQTKIVLPRRRSDLLSRPRLLRLFYDLVDYKLMIITAPAGYGKTSLLVDVAHQLDMPVGWYSIDLLDNDPQRFIAHFIAAIAHQFPDFGRQSAAVLENITLDKVSLDRLATTIVNELYEHVPEHFVLILDDFHLVNDNETIKCFLNCFIQQVDENCHLVISSRKLVNLDLILLTARRQAIGFGLHELAFQPKEVRALVLQNYNLTLSQVAAETLVQESEGWITGLLLSVQTRWRDATIRLRLAHVSEKVGVYDYLAQQVLDQQTPPIRGFLLRTSLLEEFDADLCAAVLGPGDWSLLLETVARDNLFVLRVDDKLRYHHLFQEFLQHRIAAEQPAERLRILQRLVTVRADKGQWEKAHELCQRLEDTTLTANLVEQAGLTLIENGRFTMLGQWIDDLSEQVVAARPTLLSVRGYVGVVLNEVNQGLALLNKAAQQFKQAGNLLGLARTLTWRAVAHRFLANYQASLADADEALRLAGQEEALHTIRAEALRAKGITFYHIGQLSQAGEWQKRSLEAYEELDDNHNAAVVLIELGITHSDMGQYHQALAYYNRAGEYWQKVDNLTRQAHLFNSLGVLHYFTGNYEPARESLEKAIRYAEKSGYTRLKALTLASLGDLYLLIDPEAARLAYRQAQNLSQQIGEHFILFYVKYALAKLARLQGDLLTAQEILNAALMLIAESNSVYEQGLCQLEKGQLARAKDDPQTAVVQLQRAVQSFKDRPVESIQAQMQLAVAYHAGGDLVSAFESLQAVFQASSTFENQHPLLIASLEAKELLTRAKKDALLGQRAGQLLKEISDFEQNLPVVRRQMRRKQTVVAVSPPKLVIRALGRVEVLINSKPLTSSKWTKQRTARELFFFLLAHPNGVTRSNLAHTFWPESSSSQIRVQLGNTVYKIRRALDQQDVILFDTATDSYTFNRQLDFEYDVDGFRREVERSQVLADPQERAMALQTAVSLYQGTYLPEVDRTWVLAERERLEQMYIDANLKLIDFYLELPDYRQTLKYCQQVLIQYPYLEEIQRKAMQAHAALGNRVALVRQFKQCQQALREEVDVPVSPQTKQLYKALTC